MKIAANNHSYTRTSSKSKGPDEVSDEFSQRRTTPGPDDVYDPDQSRRGQDNPSAHYYDTGSSSDGGGSWVLF